MSKKPVPQTLRRFTDEFKRDAVQVLLDGHIAGSACGRLGLSSRNLLHRWKREQLEFIGLGV